MNKTAICEYCNKSVSYTQKEEMLKACIKGETYEYMGKKAICDQCGNEIYVCEVNDYNLRQLYDQFRDKNNIISLDNILEISKKYQIGKRPLSRLLGWGEQTFSRYCEGDMPTQQYCEILQKIYDDPQYYLAILEKNKDNLNSNKTYEKSKNAALRLIQNKEPFCTSKLDVIAGYISYKVEDISYLTLQKLLYYIDGFYYAFTKQFIFVQSPQAWIKGPVYRDIYFKYENNRIIFEEFEEMFKNPKLSTLEKTIIDSVIKHIGCYNGHILTEFTKLETPWLVTRGDLSCEAESDRIIEKQLIADYFVCVKEKYNMINPSDICVYSKKMFEQING